MKEIMEKISPPLAAAFFFHLLTGEPITWMTIAATTLCACIYWVLVPFCVVVYKNIRHQTYRD